MTGFEITMADVVVGIVMAAAFGIVAMVTVAMYDPEPLEYL